MTVPKYRAYKPTKLESRIDRLVRLVSPQRQAQRVVARERENYFRYMSAYPTSSRRNSNAMTSGETLKGSREKLQVMWNAINAVENSGLCTSIVTKFQMYVCGTLKWQSRCGVRDIATQYEDYMRTALGTSLDVTGRYSLRQMAMMDLRSILVKGDVGTNIVRNGNQIQLQGIEADRIGNPYDYTITNNYVRGLELDDSGRVTGVRIFYRDRPTGMYKYESTIPMRDKRGMPLFLFLTNPLSYDDYRGVSAFKTAIDNATYIDRIREYELQALMWAASQSGVFHTKSGALPEGLPFDKINPLQDASGNPIDTYQVRPNTVTALGVGEEINMFQHDRPSPNVLGMLEATIRDISVGTGLSYGMVWDMGGFTGPAVRAVSSQDARTIEVWQWLLRENKLDPVAMLILGNAIANKELPMTPNWMKWEWFFPAKSTIDVGRESEANIAEIHAGINTGARIAANDGQDIEEIKIQRGLEVEAEIEIAQKIATDLNTPTSPVLWQQVYSLMCPQPGKGGGLMPGMGAPPGGDAPFGGGNGNGNGAAAGRNGGNGKSKSRMREPEPEGIWYSADQARDDDGKFTDEGGGVATAAGLKEDTGEHTPKIGEPFMVYRLGKGSPISNDNAGNVEAVAAHLTRVDDVEAPQPSGGTGDRVAAYKVVPHQDWGEYEGMISGKRENASLGPRIGRYVEKKNVVYSFPKSGKFTAEKIAEVPLATIRAKLKELHGTDNFDMSGTLAGADAIRKAFTEAHGFQFRMMPREVWYRPDQARDKDGKFEDEGGGAALTGLDKKLIDYKPEKRSLSDPTKLVKIADILPNTRHVPYTQMPFFRGLSAMHGVLDPEKVGGEEYKLSRDALMNRQPTTDLPYKKMVVTQPAVNKDRVAKMGESPLGVGEEGTALQPIHVVNYKGEDYVLNGHHRLVDTYVKGGTSHPAKVLNISEGAAKAYEAAAKAKPELDKMLAEVAAAHNGRALTADLKKYDGPGGALDKVLHDPGYNGDWSKIKDIARGRILVRTNKDMDAVAADLEKRLGIPHKPVNLEEQAKTGFRDYKFNPEMHGHKVEIGVLTQRINEATEESHPPYKERQQIERTALKEKRDFTPQEKERINSLNNKMREIMHRAAAEVPES